jgi:hypothetical protein
MVFCLQLGQNKRRDSAGLDWSESDDMHDPSWSFLLANAKPIPERTITPRGNDRRHAGQGD